MADKQISELVAATSVGANDLFVLEQSSTAKKLTGQILENWLVALADGHGGIQTIAKTGSTGTNPVVDTYTITFADTSTSTFTVTNGLKGDTGAQTYVWIKYASVQPTSNAQMGDLPDNWMGVYVGLSSTAPANYTDYVWYKIKGDKGDTGDSITSVELTAGNHAPGSTDTYTVYAEGNAVGAFTVWNGINGEGAVGSVNNITPDGNGNVELTPGDIGIGAASVVPDTDIVSGAVGTSTDYARGDHRHPLNVPISGTPADLGTANNGSSTNYARADHVHNMPSPANVGAMAEWDLLWVNASTSSKFSDQTIQIDLTNYDLVWCVYYNANSLDNVKSGLYRKGEQGLMTSEYLSGGTANYFRYITPSDSGVTFGAGTLAGSGYDGYYVRPLAIYGIKGVNNS